MISKAHVGWPGRPREQGAHSEAGIEAAERTELEARLERGKLPAGELANIGRRLNHGAVEVAVLEERWLAVQVEIEKLTAEAAL